MLREGLFSNYWRAAENQEYGKLTNRKPGSASTALDAHKEKKMGFVQTPPISSLKDVTKMQRALTASGSNIAQTSQQLHYLKTIVEWIVHSLWDLLGFYLSAWMSWERWFRRFRLRVTVKNINAYWGKVPSHSDTFNPKHAHNCCAWLPWPFKSTL